MAVYTPADSAALAAISPSSGDTILLATGATYLLSAFSSTFLSANNLTIGYAGTGNRPIISGGTQRTDWTFDAGNNVWSRPAYASNHWGNVTEDGVAMTFVEWSSNLATTAALMPASSFTVNPATNVVYIRPSAGVAGDHVYVLSDVANTGVADHCGLVSSAAATGLILDGLEFRNIARHGVALYNKRNVRIQNCDFRVIGGIKSGSYYMGNGLEISFGCYDVETRACRFYDIFDTCITTQLYEGSAANAAGHRYYGTVADRFGMHAIEISAQTANQAIDNILVEGVLASNGGANCWAGDRNGAVLAVVSNNTTGTRITNVAGNRITATNVKRLYIGLNHGGVCGVQNSTCSTWSGFRSGAAALNANQRDYWNNNTEDGVSAAPASMQSVTGDIRGLVVSEIEGLSVPWTPAQLFAAGEQGAWYDPSDFSTMFQDSAGTIPVTGVEQPVGLILDKSGRGNHASQATSTKRPTLRSAGGLFYLDFDGVDDALATSSGGINFTGTDKMTVWAGVRKTSDAAFGGVVELSSNYNSNAGAFSVSAPGDNNSASYGFGIRRGDYTAYLSTTFAAPIASVLSCLMNYGAAGQANQVIPRVNGVVQQNTLIGTGVLPGNFIQAPLYIGARNQVSNYFRGRLYGLIVRGAQSSPAEIAAAEAWLNGKTGAY